MDRPTVPLAYVAELAAQLADEGIAPSRTLHGTGIRVADLEDPEALVSHAQQLHAYRNAARLAPSPGVGLRVGARLRFGHHGVLGHAMMCAKDVRDEIRLSVHYSRIRGSLLEFRLREANGVGVLSAHDALPLGDLHVVAAEELLAMIAMPNLPAHADVGPFEVRIDYPAPSYSDEYEALFGCPIEFEADLLELRFTSRALDRPTELSNAEVALICEERCRAILGRLGSGGRTADRVRSHLLAESPAFELDRVARAIGVSPRTLRRQLQRDGTSFREVVTDVRKGLALDYLETTDLGLDEIGGLLGYEDPANFNRAFRRWVGESPGRYRARRRR